MRTAFRIFCRIFDVYSLPTDCHMAGRGGRQSTPGLGERQGAAQAALVAPYAPLTRERGTQDP
eukprot:1187900-Prorocentrum_minimum.AAC.1